MTAVEFLIEQICGEHKDAWKEEIKQAKQLEKSHMINFFTYGCMTQSNNLTSEEILKQFRNYYEKQFNDA